MEIDWEKIDKWVGDRGGMFGRTLDDPEKIFTGLELEIAKRIERAFWIGEHFGGQQAQVDF